MQRVTLAILAVSALPCLLAAQVPQPFPRPRDPQSPARPPPRAGPPPPPAPARPAAAGAAAPAPPAPPATHADCSAARRTAAASRGFRRGRAKRGDAGRAAASERAVPHVIRRRKGAA